MGPEQDLDSMHSMIFHSLAGACWLAVDGWRRVTSELQPQHCTVGKLRGGPHYLVAEHFFLSKPTQISIIRSHMAS